MDRSQTITRVVLINPLDKHSSNVFSLEEERVGEDAHLTPQLGGVCTGNHLFNCLCFQAFFSVSCPMSHAKPPDEQLFISPAVRCWSVFPCKQAEEEEACWQWNCSLEIYSSEQNWIVSIFKKKKKRNYSKSKDENLSKIFSSWSDSRVQIKFKYFVQRKYCLNGNVRPKE